MKKYIITVILVLVLIFITVNFLAPTKDGITKLTAIDNPKTISQPTNLTVPKSNQKQSTTTAIKFGVASTTAVGFANSINISSPSMGDKWKIGTSQTIKFTVSGPLENNYRVRLYLAGDSSGHIAVVDPNVVSSYVWNIPQTIFEGDVGSYQLAGNHKLVAELYDGEVCITGGNCNPNIKWGKLIKYIESPQFEIILN